MTKFTPLQSLSNSHSLNRSLSNSFTRSTSYPKSLTGLHSNTPNLDLKLTHSLSPFIRQLWVTHSISLSLLFSITQTLSHSLAHLYTCTRLLTHSFSRLLSLTRSPTLIHSLLLPHIELSPIHSLNTIISSPSSTHHLALYNSHFLTLSFTDPLWFTHSLTYSLCYVPISSV